MFKWTMVLPLACVALLLQPAARAADDCADMRPGLNHITVISGGEQQRIDLVLPASFSPTRSVPLVIGLHPSGGSGTTFDQDSGLTPAATAKGFAVMLPDGGIRQSPSDGDGYYWNIPGVPLIGGGAVPEGTRDDVHFIADAIDHLVKHNCVDARGGEVVLYRIDAPRDQGGGHVWPGGRRDLSTRAPSRSGGDANGSGGQPAAEFDATSVVLEFFARH